MKKTKIEHWFGCIHDAEIDQIYDLIVDAKRPGTKAAFVPDPEFRLSDTGMVILLYSGPTPRELLRERMQMRIEQGGIELVRWYLAYLIAEHERETHDLKDRAEIILYGRPPIAETQDRLLDQFIDFVAWEEEFTPEDAEDEFTMQEMDELIARYDLEFGP